RKVDGGGGGGGQEGGGGGGGGQRRRPPRLRVVADVQAALRRGGHRLRRREGPERRGGRRRRRRQRDHAPVELRAPVRAVDAIEVRDARGPGGEHVGEAHHDRHRRRLAPGAQGQLPARRLQPQRLRAEDGGHGQRDVHVQGPVGRRHVLRARQERAGRLGGDRRRRDDQVTFSVYVGVGGSVSRSRTTGGASIG